MDKALPRIKRKVKAFLLGEDGKVSKSEILKAGIVIAAAISMSADDASAHTSSHNNNYTFNNNCGDHYNVHTNHNSHGSHGSHSSW